MRYIINLLMIMASMTSFDSFSSIEKEDVQTEGGTYSAVVYTHELGDMDEVPTERREFFNGYTARERVGEVFRQADLIGSEVDGNNMEIEIENEFRVYMDIVHVKVIYFERGNDENDENYEEGRIAYIVKTRDGQWYVKFKYPIIRSVVSYKLREPHKFLPKQESGFLVKQLGLQAEYRGSCAWFALRAGIDDMHTYYDYLNREDINYSQDYSEAAYVSFTVPLDAEPVGDSEERGHLEIDDLFNRNYTVLEESTFF